MSSSFFGKCVCVCVCACMRTCVCVCVCVCVCALPDSSRGKSPMKCPPRRWYFQNFLTRTLPLRQSPVAGATERQTPVPSAPSTFSCPPREVLRSSAGSESASACQSWGTLPRGCGRRSETCRASNCKEHYRKGNLKAHHLVVLNMVRKTFMNPSFR